VRARRGVVLACGSFAYNDAMVAQYAPRIVGRPAASIEQHDGQSIRMAQALGADLAHMDATEVAFLIDPQQIVRGILVNARGQRYVPEDMYSGRIGQLTLYQQDDVAYLIIDGDAAARCGISMKGIDILVKGSIGAMSAFMAQAGSLVVLGDAGDALGDSIYEATIFVRGEVKSLGTDCIEKPMTSDDRDRLADVLRRGGLNGEARVGDFRMYGSARRLYHFHIDNIASY